MFYTRENILVESTKPQILWVIINTQNNYFKSKTLQGESFFKKYIFIKNKTDQIADTW